MKIEEMSTQSLLDLLTNESEFERKMIIELFSRLPFWNQKTVLYVPCQQNEKPDGRITLNYVRGYREHIARFTKSKEDFLALAISKTERADRFIPEIAAKLSYMNVIFINQYATSMMVRQMHNATCNSRNSPDFLLALCPDTPTYSNLCDGFNIIGKLNGYPNFITVKGTKIVRNRMFTYALSALKRILAQPSLYLFDSHGAIVPRQPNLALPITEARDDAINQLNNIGDVIFSVTAGSGTGTNSANW